MEEINIREFFEYLKERLIIIIITAVLAILLVVGYDCFIKVPKYSTYTTIALVKEGTEVTQNDLTVNKTLVDSYSILVKSKKVLKQVIKEIDSDYTVEKLAKEITVTAVNDTEYIKITVEDPSARNAYDITKSISRVFSKEVQEIYSMNNVSIVDEPEITNKVSNDTLKRDLLLGLVFGLFASTGVLFITFYFDDTIKNSENIEEELGLPVLAKVFKSRIENAKKGSKVSELVLSKYPKSVVSESVKTLRTNLQFASVEKTLRTLLVTSSIPGEGKSFISSNLAISFAQAGKRVLLIDCDMRKGRIHKIFRVNNTNGYSDLLLDNLENIGKYVKKTNVSGLSVITRGTIPPNPSELLNSTKNKEIIKELKRHFDKIIFDGVPCSGLPDSIIMSSLVDKVVIVTSNKYTPKTEYMNTKNSLEKVNAPIAGIIVNKIDSTKGAYGKYYYYYGDKN